MKQILNPHYVQISLVCQLDFVIKHKAKKFNSVDVFCKRFKYQSINIEITKLLFQCFFFKKKINMINSLNVNVISKVCTLHVVVS